MVSKLLLIVGFAVFMAAVYFCCMRATPRKGILRVLERVFVGVILCYLCSLILTPLGLLPIQGPISSLCAGYLGLPGVALMVLARVLP